MELGDFAALHGNRADAVDTIEGRLEVVCSDFPELSLRDSVRGEAVAEDGECGECEAIGGDAGGRGERLLDLAEGGVNQLEGGDHVLVPGEEQADFGRAAAGGGANSLKAGDGVDRVFNGLGDGDLHLLDGHDAVVDPDDDAGKVSSGKDRDGDLEREIDAGDGEDAGKEEDGARGTRQPEGVGEMGCGAAHSLSPSVFPAAGFESSSAAAGPTLILEPSSRP